MAAPQVQTLIFVAGSANGVCLAQAPAAAGALLLNGALVTGTVATFDAPRRVALASTGNEGATTFTITGTGRASTNAAFNSGPVISETLTIPNGQIALTQQDFATVTSITTNAAAVGNITGGTSSATTIGSGPWMAMNPHVTPGMIEHWCSVASANPSTYTVEFTPDDPNANIPPGGTAQVTGSGRPAATVPWPGSGSIEETSFVPAQAWPHKTIFNLAVSADEVVNSCAWAWRLTINSGATAVTAQAIQAGIKQ